MRAVVSTVALAFVLTAIGCGDQGNAIRDGMPQPTKSLKDLKQSQGTKMSEEELKAARRAAGFRSRDEVAAENAATFEKRAREYIKTRVPQYKKLTADLRAILKSLEDGAAGWAKAKDGQKALESFAEKYNETAKEFLTRYRELTGGEAEGGDTQAKLGKAVRGWISLNEGLSPTAASDAKFASTIAEIRAALDEVDKLVGEIEKDDTIEANKFYKEGKEGKEDEGKGDAKKK